MVLKLVIFVAFFVVNVSSFYILPWLKPPCPYNVPMVMCSHPPCSKVLNAVCKETFCGACKANCYTSWDSTEPIECTYVEEDKPIGIGELTENSGDGYLYPFLEKDPPCPDNTPMVMCSYPPCSKVTNEHCKETFCGTCKANCYSSWDLTEPIECTYVKEEKDKEIGELNENSGDSSTNPYLIGDPLCPDNTPMVMCSYPPCSRVRDAVCKETFCGTCKANCYDPVNTTKSIECTPFTEQTNNEWNEYGLNPGPINENPFGDPPCPDNTPMVMCSYSPCSKVRDSVCKDTFCGTCKANCYDPVNTTKSIECTYFEDDENNELDDYRLNPAPFNSNPFGEPPCPDNVPMVMCSHSPCSRVLNEVCKDTFCGTCKANCYDPLDITKPIECIHDDRWIPESSAIDK